jgi:hypothetical protein
MQFVNVKPPASYEIAPVKASVQVRKNGKVYVRISMSSAGQRACFGKSIRDAKMNIAVGVHPDNNKLQITLAVNGDFIAKASVKDSVFVTLSAWEGVPITSQKSAACRILRKNIEGGIVIIQMPEWFEVAKPTTLKTTRY